MRSWRTDFQFSQKVFNDQFPTLDLQLNPAVNKIADAPQQIQPGGDTCRECTKPYSLHTTDHENVCSNGWFIARLRHQALPYS